MSGRFNPVLLIFFIMADIICLRMVYATDDCAQLIFSDGKESVRVLTVGGKASKLKEISSITRVKTMPWFTIPSAWFSAYIERNNISKMIEEFDQLARQSNQKTSLLKHKAEAIQTMILNGNFLENEVSLLEKGLVKICQGKLDARVAVRSSGIMEDGHEGSMAGLYDSLLNIQGKNNVIKAIKEVWASSFNSRIILERVRLNIPQRNCLMGVIVQILIDSEVSGVVTSKVLRSGYPGYEVSATYGLGEGAVGGEISVDNWVINKNSWAIMEQTLGAKLDEFVCISGQNGINAIPVSQHRKSKFCLSNAEVIEISKLANNVVNKLGYDIDIEFAINSSREIYFLQARPLVQTAADQMVIESHPEHERLKIASGLFSTPGISIGKLLYIKALSQLESGEITVSPGEIVLAHITQNSWTHHLRSAAGIITKEGSPSSHPMLLARERKIPCVIGIRDNFEDLILHNGKIVTLDGNNQVIYAAPMQTRKATQEEILGQFSIGKIRQWTPLSTAREYLLHNKIAVEDGGKIWRKTPTFPVIGFQKEFNISRFLMLHQLTNRHDKAAILSKVIDNYVCCELIDYADYVDWFADFSLQEAEAFNESYALTLQDFLNSAMSFDLTTDAWLQFTNLYTKVRAFTFLGDALRAYANRKVDELAIAYHIPKQYLELASTEIQYNQLELDVELGNVVHSLAREIITTLNHIPGTLNDLKDENRELFNKVEFLASEYRFEHQISLENPVNLEAVYLRIKKEMTLLETLDPGVEFSSYLKDRKYLTGTPELKAWLAVSVINRTLQCNSHHIDAKARAHVHPILKELDFSLKMNGQLCRNRDIFGLYSDEIKELIRRMNR